MSIEDAVADAVSEQVEEAIGNLDLSVEIAQEVEDALSNYDFSSAVAEHIDYDDIRYSIEDDILSQVNDHVDLDYHDIGDTVQTIIQDFIFEGCSDMDVAADHILQRGMNGRNKWFIPTEEQWENRQSNFEGLQQMVAQLNLTVARLLEVINLPEVKTPTEALVDAINNGELSSKDAQFAVSST